MTTKPQPHRLIQSFEINLPGQPTRKLIGKLYHASTRTSGRRIIVEENGRHVYDTDNCYDSANAQAKLEEWCVRQARYAECAHCGQIIGVKDHGQDAETGAPMCSDCCEAGMSANAQTASMTAEDLAVSVATLAAVKREEPEKLAAVAVDEVGEDGYPAEFPF